MRGLGHVVILLQVVLLLTKIWKGAFVPLPCPFGSDGTACYPVAIRKEKYCDALKKLRASKMG